MSKNRPNPTKLPIQVTLKLALSNLFLLFFKLAVRAASGLPKNRKKSEKNVRKKMSEKMSDKNVSNVLVAHYIM
jgi:hypothetical protein